MGFPGNLKHPSSRKVILNVADQISINLPGKSGKEGAHEQQCANDRFHFENTTIMKNYSSTVGGAI
jgi:hypothetical protein